MPLNIVTNKGSISVQNTLTKSNMEMQNSIRNLSSGLRINSAADDAAGLAVSEGLRAQIGGFRQATSNATQGVAMLQTADSAMQSVSDILIRMRSLAVQAASDTLTDAERAHVNTEFTDLISEIDRIAAVTEYNGQKLLDGTAGDGAGNVVLQVGTRNTANDRITLALVDTDTTGLAINTDTVDSLATAQTSIDSIDAALSTLNTRRASLGATMNQLGKSIDNLGSTVENLSVANGNIRDVDVARESANFARAQVLQQAGTAMLAQANSTPQLALRLLGQ